MEHYKLMKLSFVFLLLAQLPLIFTLKVGFYDQTCPQAELIIRQAVQQKFKDTKATITPALLRMHFHDCFVRGCDASILINSTSKNSAEKDAGPNLTVREFAFIDQIKTKLEAACPQTVSCADIIAVATRDSVALAGGPMYNVRTGRRDGIDSKASEVNLPGPTFTVAQAAQSFRAKGMTLNDMVTLLGSHTTGFVHCSFFQDRLTNFQGTGAPDRTMRKGMVTKLQRLCGSNPNIDNTVFLDQNTSLVFDNEYYNQIMKRRAVLQIDQELGLDPLSSSLVSKLASDGKFFGQSFAKAIIKMGKIQVLEGSSGQIRKICSAIN